MSILEVNNVSIRYMTGDFKDIGIKEYVTRRLRGKYEVKKFWADKHVTFTLEQGDMLGIIGTNGAGKHLSPWSHAGLYPQVHERDVRPDHRVCRPEGV